MEVIKRKRNGVKENKKGGGERGARQGGCKAGGIFLIKDGILMRRGGNHVVDRVDRDGRVVEIVRGLTPPYTRR